MKKFYLFALAISISYCTFGQQRPVGSAITLNADYSNAQKVLTPTDTLFGWLINGGTPTIYTSTNGGFVCGVNGYGDFAKMQQFVVTTPYNVEGAIFWFGGKGEGSSVGDPNSKIVCNIYNMDGTGDNSTGTGVTAPGTIASSVDVLWDDIDTSATGAGGFVYVTFSAPFNATTDYAVGVDFTTLATTDTTGLVSNASGEAGATELSWEEWNDNTLHTIFSAWGTAPNNVDIDLGVFPIVDLSGANSINEIQAINGIKLFQNQPNPFQSLSTVSYELENNAKNVTILVFDVNGKLAKTIEQGSQNAGSYTLELNAADFAGGNYTIAIQADSHRLAQKFTVAK
jgi:hypothetical protein